MLNEEALRSHIIKLNNRLAFEKTIVVVEGKNDLLALKPILKADFFVLNKSHKSLYETAEQIASKYRSAILLLDADAKGKELRAKMSPYLQSHGIHVLVEDKLLKLAKVRCVEDLRSAFSRAF